MSRLACRGYGLRLAANSGGHVDFDQHAGMRELVDIEECMRRARSAGERFGETLKIDAGGPDVGNIGDDLHDIRHGGTVTCESSPDLVKGVAALAGDVARIEDRADLSVFVFRA